MGALRRWPTWRLSLCGALGTLAITPLLRPMLESLLQTYGESSPAPQALLDLPQLVIFALLVGPVLETLLVQVAVLDCLGTRLSPSQGRPLAALAVSAILFGTAHDDSVAELVASGVHALVWGGLYLIAGSGPRGAVVAWGAHTLHNAVGVMAVAVGVAPGRPGS